jgi:pimeloyl-ACP methyl ester carboxylesterase
MTYNYAEYPGDIDNITLIHGFASSTYTWQSVAQYLNEKGYHVWALDMKGFGWSDKPRDSRYDPVSLMEGVNEWMAAVGLERVVCADNSIGGAVTVLLALQHPERVGSMILIDAAGYPIKKPIIIRLADVPLSGGMVKLIFDAGW